MQMFVDNDHMAVITVIVNFLKCPRIFLLPVIMF